MARTNVYPDMNGSGEIAEGALARFTSMATTAGGAEGIAEEQFDGIVLAHQRRIFRVLYSLVRDHDTADTLTQECFLRAYRKRRSFRGEASVGTWLVRIATNLARDHARNRRAAFWRKLLQKNPDGHAAPRPLDIPDPAPSPERVVLAREQLESVWTAVEQLPQQQRTAFALRFAGDMTLEEIADVMELEVGTVKAHLFRAVSAIKKERRKKP